jgi:multiple sugar transport system ATP-binding protein
VLMDQGRVRQAGAPMELYHDPADIFVATFLGAPAMNLIPGEAVPGRFACEALAVALDQGVPPGPCTLGIRPEALALAGPGPAIRVRAGHVEHLGAETLVEAEPEAMPGQSLVARLPGTVPVARGAPLTLFADPAAMHLFDAQGRTLRRAVLPLAARVPAV